MKRFRCTHREELFVEIVACINAFRLLYSHAPFITSIPITPSLPAPPPQIPDFCFMIHLIYPWPSVLPLAWDSPLGPVGVSSRYTAEGRYSFSP